MGRKIYRLDRLFVEIPALRPESIGAYSLAVVLVICATGLRLAMEPFVDGVQYITFFPAVIITTFVSGMRAGSLCMVLSAVAAAIFVFPPRGQVDFAELNQFASAGFFILVGTMDVLLIGALRIAIMRQRTLSNALMAQTATLRASEERQSMLAREIDHRAKNLLSVVQAILSLTRASNMKEFSDAVSGRIGALAISQNLISASRWRGADLGQIIEDELAAYRPDDGQSHHKAHIETSGPRVTLIPSAAQSIALAIHELATNAVKYGALSSSTGRLSVEWRAAEAGMLLSWAESGGPSVPGPPERKSFGMKVIAAGIEKQLGGKVAIDWRLQGIAVTITVPLTALVAEGSTVEEKHEPAGPAVATPEIGGRAMAGARILVVEDESLIAMQIGSALVRLECRVVGPVSRPAQALEVLRAEAVDAAIIDANLAGESGAPVAAALRERGIPFIVLTGYAEAGLPAGFNGAPVASKPFDEQWITRLLAHQLATRLHPEP